MESTSEDEFVSMQTLIKMFFMSGLLFLGCFAMCLGSTSLTLMRIRWSSDRVRVGNFRDVLDHDHPSPPPDPRPDVYNTAGEETRRAIDIAEKACNDAIDRVVGKYVPRETRLDILSPEPSPRDSAGSSLIGLH